MISRSISHVYVVAIVLFSFNVGSGFGQTPPEANPDVLKRAAAARHAGDLDTSIKLYTEAIDLFPKIDEYTPKPRATAPYTYGIEYINYAGLDWLYFGRSLAYWAKKDSEMAEKDVNASLIVVKGQVARNLENVTRRLAAVDITEEKKIANPNSHNSQLVNSASLFGVIKMQCPGLLIRYKNDPLVEYEMVPRELLSKKPVIDNIAEIKSGCRTAAFGEVDTFYKVISETGNRTFYFSTLKLANELVAAYPNDIESYRLRAKVNRFLGNDQQAVSDEQIIEKLINQK